MKKLAPLDELYFTWLYGQVASIGSSNPQRTHWRMLKILYTTPFVHFVPHDENRATDGVDIREEFVSEEGLERVDQDWLTLECSFLEMVLALARHISFEVDGAPRRWFWKLLENLELTKFNDDSRFREDSIRHILQTVNARTYEPDGRGGLFPLKHPDGDQRMVELWYQMQSYLLELD